MRPNPPTLLRHLTRGLAGPVPRGFTTAASRLTAEDSLMYGLLGKATIFDAAQEIDEASGRKGHAKYQPQDQNGRGPSSGLRQPRFTVKVVRPGILHAGWDRLSLESPELSQRSFPYFVLRDMCKCRLCVDPHSRQRSFRTSDIPDTVRPQHIRWDGKELEIVWANDIPGHPEGHTSRWTVKQLKRSILNRGFLNSNTKPRYLSRRQMELSQHWVSYKDYMNNDEEFAKALRAISLLGFIFIKDIPDSRGEVEKIATRMGPLRNTFYGPTWDVRSVPRAKNVAYTNQFLGFHMDLMYMNEPPGYQLLHCLENSCKGGESLFSDSFRAAAILRTKYPRQFEILTRRHLAYQYFHSDHVYYNTRPVIELDEEQHIRYVNYSPPFQAALPLSQWERETEREELPLFKSALRLFAALLQSKDAVFQLKLDPGQCVIFANRRIAHARREFDTTSGSRWLAGAYVDEDAVRSRIYVAQRTQHSTKKQLAQHDTPAFQPSEAEVIGRTGESEDTEWSIPPEDMEEFEQDKKPEQALRHELPGVKKDN
ncbi:uncharacterized protein N7459_002374 [Penicillium hispanicum]|uniref:uncharacterized protein n=1 Tax=Penicillium hispanicum TaxID=1080232 RepID=UPI0025407E59|nr:uncharacterized protein N7459_002374 [Penicillium hispanicum]KAJ5592005.1 hypothetical protein N7459_002374 [Penicillium hispanicum]